MALEDVQDILGNNPWSVRSPGARPPGMSGSSDALAAALRGIVTPSIAEGGRVTPIAPGRQKPIVPQGESMRPAIGAPMTPVSAGGAGGGGGGGSAIAAGLGKIGSALSGGLEAIAAKQKAKQADLAAAQAAGLNKPADFLTPPVAPAAPPAAGGGLPTFTQPGVSGVVPDKTAGGDGYLATLAKIENPSGDPFATSPTGATGKYQFLPSTWRQYGNGADIHDSAAQDAAMARFTQDNFNTLQKGLGRNPTDGELYLAHQQGAGSALKLLRNPDTPAGSLVSARNIQVNHGDPNAPASAFTGKWTGKFGGGQSFADLAQDRQQDAVDTSAPQVATAPSAPVRPDVIPGQQDPHVPGFDAGSVPYLGKQGMAQPPPMGPQDPTINPLAAALAGGQDQSQQLPNPALIAALLGDQGGFDVGGLFG